METQRIVDPVRLIAEALKTQDDNNCRRRVAEALATTSTLYSKMILNQCEIAEYVDDHPFRRQWTLAFGTERELHKQFKVLDHGLQPHPNIGISFHRGFPATATTDMATFLDHGEECLSVVLFPFLNRLELIGETARLNEFSACERLSQFEHLRFAEVLINDKSLSQFLSSPFIFRLKSLDFTHWGECDDKNELRTYGGIITADGASQLSRAHRLSHLTNLNLGLNDLQADGAALLAKSPVFGALRTLQIGWNDIGDAGLIAISRSTSLRALSHLGVSCNKITADGLDAVLSSQLGQQLRSLDISANDLGGNCGKIVARLPELKSLHSLYLRGCQLVGSDFTSIIEGKLMTQLRVLSVTSNSIGPDFLRIFGTQHRLEHIDAIGNEITDEPWFDHGSVDNEATNPTLTSMNLFGNELGDNFARELSINPQFRNLQILDLRGNPIGDQGAACIRQSPILRDLKLLSLSPLKLSENEKQLLNERFGDGLDLAY